MGFAIRIMPMDVGGPGGVNPSTKVRLTQRQTWNGLEFVVNPHYTEEQGIGTMRAYAGRLSRRPPSLGPSPAHPSTADAQAGLAAVPLPSLRSPALVWKDPGGGPSVWP